MNSDRYIEFKLNEIIIWLNFLLGLCLFCLCVCVRLCVLMFEENYHLSNVIVWKVMISEYVIQFTIVIEKSNQFPNYHIRNWPSYSQVCHMICLFSLSLPYTFIYTHTHCTPIYTNELLVLLFIRKTNVNLIQIYHENGACQKKTENSFLFRIFVVTIINFSGGGPNAIPIFLYK